MENNYQLSRIQNYISGLMNKEEMFQLEKEALEDPFLQDAIEGYRMQGSRCATIEFIAAETKPSR